MNERDTLKVIGSDLFIGGVKAADLAKEFKTPLYVLDLSYIEKMMKIFKGTLIENYGDGEVLYASKALSFKGIYQLAKKQNIGVDVVSDGELQTALSVDFSPGKIYYHGNNKTFSELENAVKAGVKCVVVDSIHELETLNEISKSYGKTQKIMLRLNPGVEAHTHDFIQTAKPDSKFGFNIENGDAEKTVAHALTFPNLNLLGFHCHIGSQIFDESAFLIAADTMLAFMKKMRDDHGFEASELNLGGGYGIHYTEEDKKFTQEDYSNYLRAICLKVKSKADELGLKKPFLIFEPGRSIVGEAGITLYTVGNIKEIKNLRKYVAVDGGIFDNPRYALYGAKYESTIATKCDQEKNDLVTIAGKCCESGDLIAKDTMLQKAEPGDILAVFSTGAYNYSMSSNYNSNLKPAMVGVKNGKSQILVRRQTIQELLERDQLLKD